MFYSNLFIPVQINPVSRNVAFFSPAQHGYNEMLKQRKLLMILKLLYSLHSHFVLYFIKDITVY